jgi:hypothetical protein
MRMRTTERKGRKRTQKSQKSPRELFEFLYVLLRLLRNLCAAGSTGQCNIIVNMMFKDQYGKT